MNKREIKTKSEQFAVSKALRTARFVWEKFVGMVLIMVCIITVKSMVFYKVFKVKPEKPICNKGVFWVYYRL